MIYKITKNLIILIIFCQNPLYSKNTTFSNINSKYLSNYFSGIVAYKNQSNYEALKFFRASKILLNEHKPYLQNYIYSLVIENKVKDAINTIKQNTKKDNSNFFEAYILLVLDSIKKSDFELAEGYLIEASNFTNQERFNIITIESLKQYIFVFKEKKIINKKKNFGTISLINETFQKCYLEHENTKTYFFNLLNNDLKDDNSRYMFFYISYLIENEELNLATEITNQLDVMSTPLLLSQGKNWIDNNELRKFNKIFSCKNHNDIISEFLFLMSNLYSSQGNYEKSNFYLNLSQYLNPKFYFNLSLIVENHYKNGDFDKVKKVLENFDTVDNFYYWYKLKKQAQIIAKKKK